MSTKKGKGGGGGKATRSVTTVFDSDEEFPPMSLSLSMGQK